MALDIKFEIPSISEQKGMTVSSVTAITASAQRPAECVYDYQGGRRLMLGKVVGEIVVKVDSFPASLADGLKALQEGTRGGKTFSVTIAGMMRVTGCVAARRAPRSVSLRPGALMTDSFIITVSGDTPTGVSDANPRIAGGFGNYILPSMPGLCNLSVDTRTTLAAQSVATVNLGALTTSGLPDYTMTIAGEMYNKASLPADLIPLIENSPRAADTADDKGSPLMELWIGAEGSCQRVTNAVNVASQFEFAADGGNVMVKATRQFKVFSELLPDSTPL